MTVKVLQVHYISRFVTLRVLITPLSYEGRETDKLIRVCSWKGIKINKIRTNKTQIPL